MKTSLLVAFAPGTENLTNASHLFKELSVVAPFIKKDNINILNGITDTKAS